MTVATPTRCMTPSEAAEHLGCTPVHVTRLLRSGELRGLRIGKTRWAIPVADFERFIADRRDLALRDADPNA